MIIPSFYSHKFNIRVCPNTEVNVGKITVIYYCIKIQIIKNISYTISILLHIIILYFCIKYVLLEFLEISSYDRLIRMSVRFHGI